MSPFHKKSQASTEFLIIFGISFALIIVLGGIFYTYSSGAKQSLDKKQIELIGQELTSNIEKVYFLGKGNRITQHSNFPDNIIDFTIHHWETSLGVPFDYLNITIIQEEATLSNIFLTAEPYIRFNCTQCYHDPARNLSYFNSSDYNLGGKYIRIESKGDWVSIDFIKE